MNSKSQRVSEMKIISGGQTGVDQLALFTAKNCGLETGGWCTRGFVTSRGKEPRLATEYGLREIDFKGTLSQQYVLRSQKNVDEADATLVFRYWESVGSDKTIGYAETGRWTVLNGDLKTTKKCFVVTYPDPKFADLILQFIHRNQVKVLNVAGHREIGDMCEGTQSILEKVFKRLAEWSFPSLSHMGPLESAFKKVSEQKKPVDWNKPGMMAGNQIPQYDDTVTQEEFIKKHSRHLGPLEPVGTVPETESSE